MKHFLLFLIALTMAVAASAQNYRRPTPNKPARHAAAAQTVEIQCDTVANPPADSVVVTGFDKQLRSKRETMFVSNHTARAITSITLRIALSLQILAISTLKSSLLPYKSRSSCCRS